MTDLQQDLQAAAARRDELIVALGVANRLVQDLKDQVASAARAAIAPADHTQVTTILGRDPAAVRAQQIAEGNTGMHADYVVLTDAERAKGFVQPVRTAYRHLRCGTVTYMGRMLAETYARAPTFYGSTYCCACRAHFPVGRDGEFVWDGTTVKVGT